MNRVRFSYLKLIAAAGVLAIAIIPSMRPSIAKNQPAANAPVAADLRNEERIIGKYFDDLIAYQQECWQLKKRAALRSADIDPLQQKSDALKSRLSEVQNAIREVVRKLKAANEWDDLDTRLLANTTDARQRSLFQESSFKADLEEAAASLSSHKDEISVPLDGLRKRLARRTLSPFGEGAVTMIPAAYSVAPMKFVSLACSIGIIKMKIVKSTTGVGDCGLQDQVSCACNNNKGGGICTGANCPGQATS